MKLTIICYVAQIMTATVETVMEQLDLAPIIMAERSLPAVARAVTLTDTDVGQSPLLYTILYNMLFKNLFTLHLSRSNFKQI